MGLAEFCETISYVPSDPSSLIAQEALNSFRPETKPWDILLSQHPRKPNGDCYLWGLQIGVDGFTQMSKRSQHRGHSRTGSWRFDIVVNFWKLQELVWGNPDFQLLLEKKKPKRSDTWELGLWCHLMVETKSFPLWCYLKSAGQHQLRSSYANAILPRCSHCGLGSSWWTRVGTLMCPWTWCSHIAELSVLVMICLSSWLPLLLSVNHLCFLPNQLSR